MTGCHCFAPEHGREGSVPGRCNTGLPEGKREKGMPTERFLKLGEEKRRRIMEAAVEEFANYSIADASINRVIRSAGISRGSFYTYFDDKEDLFRYVLRDFRDAAALGILETVRGCGYEPVAAARKLTEAALLIRGDRSTVRGKLCNVLMTDFKVLDQIRSLAEENCEADRISAQQADEEAYRQFRAKHRLSRQDYHAAVDMIFVASLKSIVICYRYPEKTEEELELLGRQYDMIESFIQSLDKAGSSEKEA